MANNTSSRASLANWQAEMSSGDEPRRLAVLKCLLNSIEETILEVAGTKANPIGLGAPGGHIYAALMSAGVTYDQFSQLMDILERTQRIERCGSNLWRAKA